MNDTDNRTFVEMAKQILAEADDVTACAEQARKNSLAASEVLQAIRDRIEEEKRQNAVDLEITRKAARDPARTQTARKLSSLEVERLEAWRPQMLEDEKTLFQDAVAEGRQAVSDWRGLKEKLTTDLKEIQTELESFKPHVLTSGLDPDQIETTMNMTEGRFRAFENSMKPSEQ